VILGLTGTIGSGKSTVARIFQELAGAIVVDADSIAHEVQEPGGAAYEAIVNAFGKEVLLPDGRISRAKLGELVFRDPQKRALLNKIIHPRVRERELELLEKYREHPLVILMVPLLFENQMESLVDKVLVVATHDAIRRERLKARSGWDDDEISRRLAAQLSDDEKIRRADYVIWNNGSVQETQSQVETLLKKLGFLQTA